MAPFVRDRRRTGPRAAAGLALALALMPAPAAAAEPQPPAPPATAPIWTQVPTRIDPSADTRERLPPVPAIEARSAYRLTEARLAADGGLIAAGRRLRLFGLKPVAPGLICMASDGRRWACGLRARAALGNLVVPRGLRCRPIGDPEAEIAVVECLRGERSVVERLAAEGWADLDAEGSVDPTLAAALAEARRAGRGLWSPDLPE